MSVIDDMYMEYKKYHGSVQAPVRFFELLDKEDHEKVKGKKTMTIEKNNTKNEAAIRELIDRFAKAFRAKDVNGVMSFFAPEIVSFDIVPPLQAVGAETFVKHWQEFFESYQTIHVEFPDVRITAGNDLAFSHCLHRVKGTMKNGGQTDWWLRWTACYRKINGKWLIVHEQVSVPVDFESGRALLDLEP
jgi:uncharacterized protein (TIGR02246 family)